MLNSMRTILLFNPIISDGLFRLSIFFLQVECIFLSPNFHPTAFAAFLLQKKGFYFPFPNIIFRVSYSVIFQSYDQLF